MQIDQYRPRLTFSSDGLFQTSEHPENVFCKLTMKQIWWQEIRQRTECEEETDTWNKETERSRLMENKWPTIGVNPHLLLSCRGIEAFLSVARNWRIKWWRGDYTLWQVPFRNTPQPFQHPHIRAALCGLLITRNKEAMDPDLARVIPGNQEREASLFPSCTWGETMELINALWIFLWGEVREMIEITTVINVSDRPVIHMNQSASSKAATIN